MRTLTPAPDIVLRTVESDADLIDLAWWLHQRRSQGLGIDCETNAEEPTSPWFRIRTVQISDSWESWVVHVHTVSLRNLARLIFEHDEWWAHYAEADIRFLNAGVPGAVRLDQKDPHIRDTQTLLAWYDPRTVTSLDDAYGGIPLPRGLKPTVARELPGQLLTWAEDLRDEAFREITPKGMRAAEDVIRHGFANVDIGDPRFTLYAGLDPLYTIRLALMMLAEVTRRGQAAGLHGDLRLQWHIDLMTLRGLEIDPTYAVWLDRQLQQVVDERTPYLAAHGIKPSGMGPAVGAALELLGAVSTKSSFKTGAVSWDKDVLRDVAGQGGNAGELAQAIIAVRKAGKFRSAYIAPMLACLPYDGRIHPSMRACGTITSRQSAMRPPVQQLPKKDTRVRAAVRAYLGCVLVGCDLSQGEPRTMAALSGDRNLLADILAGDLNSALATATFGNLYDAAQGQDAGTTHYLMRQSAKAGFLAWCYGAGDTKVATTLGIEGARGAEITARWRRRYPDLARYRDDQNSRRFITLDNGWVAPLWDRAFLDKDTGRIIDKRKPSRKGLNYSTQGNQRQLLARAVHLLVDWGWSWALAMLVHDEILLCVPEWMAEQAKAALERAMTTTYRGVPIECHAEVLGTTWAPQPKDWDMSELEAVTL
jgi:DNA polymerase-1